MFPILPAPDRHMPAHAYWKGYLKISLVSLPVKAYTATSEARGGIHFHQLHATCHSRIKHVKTCPVHGEVTSDEIVSGYEFAKDQYVVVEPDDGSLLPAIGQPTAPAAARANSSSPALRTTASPRPPRATLARQPSWAWRRIAAMTRPPSTNARKSHPGCRMNSC